MSYDKDNWYSDCVDLAYQLRDLMLEMWEEDLINNEEARDKVHGLLREAEIILDK